MANSRRSIDLIALGDTVVEGKSFVARGHRISYEQAKDLLLLEGSSRSEAELWHQARVGGPTSYSQSRRIFYWPKTKNVKADDWKFLDLNSLGWGRTKTRR